MRTWIGKGEEEQRKMKQEELERINKLRDNQIFLKEQMVALQMSKKQAALSKSPIRGVMNEQEIRMNRQILLEIGSRKRMQQS